jgi:hypothetical protein
LKGKDSGMMQSSMTHSIHYTPLVVLLGSVTIIILSVRQESVQSVPDVTKAKHENIIA